MQGPPGHLDAVVDHLGTVDLGIIDLGDSGTVVDLGTGTGVLLSRLSSRARTVIGIDASTEMLQIARRNVTSQGLGNVELRLGALEHLPVPDHQADVMVANMVLHHVANPADVLREVHRGLRPGGLFLLADLATHSEESYREKLGALWLGFERQELETWLEEAYLELIEFAELAGQNDRPTVIVVTARAREDAVALITQNVKNEL